MRRRKEKPATRGGTSAGRGKRKTGNKHRKTHKPITIVDFKKVLIGKLAITAPPNTMARTDMKAAKRKNGVSNDAPRLLSKITVPIIISTIPNMTRFRVRRLVALPTTQFNRPNYYSAQEIHI